MYKNNKKGVALVAVILIFAVLAILTSSIGISVYGDYKFSQSDEKHKIALYAARSAVESVEGAIRSEIQDLDGIRSQMTSSTITQSELDILSAKYNILLDKIYGTAAKVVVLPNSSHPTVNHTVNMGDVGLDISSSNAVVSVNYLSSNKYQLISSVTSSGYNATAEKIIGATKQVENININGNLSFRDAITAKGDVIFNNNNTVVGKIRAGGNITKGNNNNVDPKTPLDPNATFKTASAFFTDIKSKAGVTLSNITTSLPNNINSTKNGVYTNPVNFGNNSDYTVDTSNSDVFLQINQLSNIGNSVNIYVNGDKTKNNGVPHALFLYVKDITNGGSNGFTLKGTDAEIYFILDKTAGNEVGKNNIFGTNLYMYAPESDLYLKNSSTISGSVICKTFTPQGNVNNNDIITYKPPQNSIINGLTYYDSGGTEIIATQINTVSLDTNSHWVNH